MISIASRSGLAGWALPLVLVVALLFTAASMSRAQSEAATPASPPAGNKQDLAAKDAMECCKLGMKMAPNTANQSAAMECCELGMKVMPGAPSKDKTMECCKRGRKGVAPGPGTEELKTEKK